MNLYDLHTHSDISDGTLKPADLVFKAFKKGLTSVALTDHDTTAGCAAKEAQRLGIRFIPGVEISAEEFSELHILGIGIDINSCGLKTEMKKCADSRREHIINICDILKNNGIELDVEKIFSSARYSVGKPHIANEMVRMGIVTDSREAFGKYLETPEMKALSKYKIGYERAAKLIHEAGGLVVLAHPHKIELKGTTLEEFIMSFDGLDGIEAFYSEHNLEDVEPLLRLAEKNNLLISCGSDFHGSNKPDIDIGTGLNGSLIRQREHFDIDEQRFIINNI